MSERVIVLAALPSDSESDDRLKQYKLLDLPDLEYLDLCSLQVFVQEAPNPSKVKVYGPALEKPVKTFEPTYLIVDCSEAGPGRALPVQLPWLGAQYLNKRAPTTLWSPYHPVDMMPN